MTNYILPSIILIIITYGLYKRINIYESFINGIKEGLKIIIKIFPTIFSFYIAIDILIKSNLLIDIANLISPLLNILKFPKELLAISIMRPISGSSSLILLNNIYTKYTPDSNIGRIASLIQGSTDTTIYIISLYFSSIGIKKIKYAMIVGLLADLAAIILSIILINIIF